MKLADRDQSRGAVLIASVLSIGFIWIISWYWSTALQILDIWLRSDTFAHGLVVVPIFIWLVWRKRADLEGARPEPELIMALPVAIAGFLWLLGALVSVDSLSHFGLVALVILGFAAILGFRLSRTLAFPLLFLLFAVPVGEFIQPILMHYTAEFTIMGLRLSGVPVYQEGLFFVIPNGRWSVVEACSGLRYLVASLFVGTLYAYLNYRTTKRRLLFMLIALIVPIVANWVRAYLTVMIGYLFGNEFVQGFIHIIYGWVFFGIVILLMFWIGSRWREDDPLPQTQLEEAKPDLSAGGFRLIPVVVVAATIAVFPTVYAVVTQPVEPFQVSLRELEPQAGWTEVDDLRLDFVPGYQAARGTLLQTFQDANGAIVQLYVAYYAKQREDSELVSWHNRLVGKNPYHYREVTNRSDELPTGSARQSLLATELDRPKLAAWHWYWSNGRVLTSPYLAKAILALDRLTGKPDDAAFIAVYAPYQQHPSEARAVIEGFLSAHGPLLDDLLVSTEFAQ